MKQTIKLTLLFEVESDTLDGLDKATTDLLRFGIENFKGLETPDYKVENTRIGSIEPATPELLEKNA